MKVNAIVFTIMLAAMTFMSLAVSVQAAPETMVKTTYNELPDMMSSSVEIDRVTEEEDVAKVYDLIEDFSNGRGDFVGFFNEKFTNPSRKAQALLKLYLGKLFLFTRIQGIEVGQYIQEETGSSVPVVAASIGGVSLAAVAGLYTVKGFKIANKKMISILENSGRYLNESDFLRRVSEMEVRLRMSPVFMFKKEMELKNQETRLKMFQKRAKKSQLLLDKYHAVDQAVANKDIMRTKINSSLKEIVKLGNESAVATQKGSYAWSAFIKRKIDDLVRDKIALENEYKINSERITTSKAALTKEEKLQRKTFKVIAKENIAKADSAKISYEKSSAKFKAFEKEVMKETKILNSEYKKLQRRFKATLVSDQFGRRIKNVLAKSNLHSLRRLMGVFSTAVIPLAVVENIIFTLSPTEVIYFEASGLDPAKEVEKLMQKISEIDNEIYKINNQ